MFDDSLYTVETLKVITSLTLGACAGGLQYLVCVVCLSVQTISAIALNKTPKKGHHKNQRSMGKILKKVFCF